MSSRLFPGLLAGLAAVLILLPADRADDVPDCTEQDFVNTVLTTSDGTVTFSEDCDITLSQSITIPTGTSLVIDAQDNKVSINAGGHGPIFILQTNVSLTISGITLTGGINTNGGAIYIDKHCQVLLTNCAVTGNSAVGFSGTAGANGDRVYGGYKNGQSGGNGLPGTNAFGGAIYNLGRLTVLNCALSGNSVTGGSGGSGGNGSNGETNYSSYHGGNGGNGGAAGVGFGGAIYSSGTLLLYNCMVTSNSAAGGNGGAGGTNGAGYAPSYLGSGGAGASGYGAGICSIRSFTAVNCTFASNTATAGTSAAAGTALAEGPDGKNGGSSLGGGVFTAGGAFTNCTFVLNSVTGSAGAAGGAGAGTFLTGGKGGNGGGAAGGGLYNTGAVAVVHCTFAFCGASGGDAGAGGSGTPSGIDGNPGVSRGGGIANYLGKMILMNSLFATNSPGANAYGTIIDAGYNISSDLTPSAFGRFSRRNLDPQITPLAENGGVTNLAGPMLTMGPSSVRSPAYGVIDTNTTNYVLTFDERGAPRPGGGKRGSDIGAYEIGPPFIQNKTNQLQYEYPTYGDSVTFHVLPVGDSPLSYYWFYNGTNQASVGTDTYTISSVTNGNRGILQLGGYQVIVSNIYGVVTSAPAIVHFIPSILTPPTNQVVWARDPVTNQAAVMGDPNFDYQWRFYATNLLRPGALTLGNTSTNSSFVFPNSTTNDSGPYTLVITNTYGSYTSAVATIKVDQIDSQPASQTVAANAQVVFSVSVNGSPDKKYLWYFKPDGGNSYSQQETAPDTSFQSFSFSAQKTNQGYYYVVISDSPSGYVPAIPKPSDVAFLTVVATGPAISNQPAGQVVVQSSNAFFTVSATGDALNYQWRLNGIAIPNATTNSYTLVAAQLADTGNYDVVVTNLVGSVTSAPAKLTVVSSLPNTNSVALSNNQATSVQVVGGIAYVAFANTNPASGLLETVDASSFATNTPLSVAGPALSVFVLQNNAFVSCGASGLEVVDATFPSSLAPLATNTAAAPALACFVTNGYAYVAAGTNGLQVVDVSSPTSLVPTALTNLSNAISICVAGKYAYVGDGNNGLNILNVSTPANPTWVTNYATGAAVLGMRISSNFLYIAGAGAGLQILSLTDPANPVLVASNTASRSAKGLAIWSNYVLVADGVNGLLAFDVSALPNVQLAGSSLVGDARGVDVSGNSAYVATADNGLVSLNIGQLVQRSPAKIRVQPQDVAVGQGSNATFSVTAVGAAPISYQWWLSNAVSVLQSGYTNSSMTISNAQAVAGYYVIVSNSLGSDTSRVAQLTLLPCTYTLSSSEVEFTSDPTNGSFYVTNSGACNWSAITGSDWITSVVGSGTTNANVVSYQVAGNPSTNARTGFIFITDFTQTNQFTIVQDGASPPEYSLDVDSANPEGGVDIVASPLDHNGDGGGTTWFTLYYHSNTVVTLTAPSTLDTGVFQKWQLSDGTYITNTPTLSFYMRGNYALIAVYLSPLSFVKGTYNGLFYQGQSDGVITGADSASSGSFKLTTTTKGKYTGALQLGSTRYSLSGQFATNGVASTKTVTNRNHSSVQVDMAITPDNTAEVTGTVSIVTTNGDTPSSDLVAYLATFDGRINVPSQQGLYTMVIPGTDDPSGPGGDSYGTVSVSKAGAVRVAGALADGTKFSQSSFLSPDGQGPLFVPLYSGQGLLLSWIALGQEGNDLSGDMSWIKPVLPKAKYYPGGFMENPTAFGSRYAHPPKGTAVLPFNVGEIVLSGGDLSETLTYPVTLNFNNSVSGTNHTSVGISLQSGLFSGHVVNPATKKSLSFNGVVLTNAGYGDGYFLGTNLSGQVLFQQRQ